MGTQPSQQPLPTFGPCLLWPNGRPSQQLLSSCFHNPSKNTFCRGKHPTLIIAWVWAADCNYIHTEMLVNLHLSRLCHQLISQVYYFYWFAVLSAGLAHNCIKIHETLGKHLKYYWKQLYYECWIHSHVLTFTCFDLFVHLYFFGLWLLLMSMAAVSWLYFVVIYLWSSYVIGRPYIFSSCNFYLFFLA